MFSAYCILLVAFGLNWFCKSVIWHYKDIYIYIFVMVAENMLYWKKIKTCHIWWWGKKTCLMNCLIFRDFGVNCIRHKFIIVVTYNNAGCLYDGKLFKQIWYCLFRHTLLCFNQFNIININFSIILMPYVLSFCFCSTFYNMKFT